MTVDQKTITREAAVKRLQSSWQLYYHWVKDFRHRSLLYKIFLTVGTDCNNDPFTSHFAIVRSYVVSSFPWQKCLTLKPDLAKNAHVSSSEKMYPIIEEEDSASSDQ